MFLTDALGSVIETISAQANTATVQSSMGTAKAFTGQYTDIVSGLDYYMAR
jgi:hypothetical protein